MAFTLGLRMGDDEPAVRGRAVHDALRLLDEFESGATAEARERVPADSLAVIDSTSDLGWVPIEHDHHVPASVIDVLGADRAHSYFRSLLARQLEAPLLRSSWAATRKLFGLSPGSLARAVPVGWPIVYRGFCSPEIQSQRAHEVTISMTHVHPQVFEYLEYPTSFAGFFAGFFDVCDVDGSVESTIDAEQRVIRFVLHWQ